MGESCDTGTTRSTFLRRAALASGASLTGAGAGVILALPSPASSAPSSAQDAKTLAYLLELEDLQTAFYEDALSRGALTGEVLEYARVVGAHEQEHVTYLRGAIGAKAAKPASFDFGEKTVDPKTFLKTAVDIEETGLAAYTGAAVNLTPDVLRDAARIVSVEARHTAWARDLLGRNPAPNASDKAASEAEVRATIRRTAFVKQGG